MFLDAQLTLDIINGAGTIAHTTGVTGIDSLKYTTLTEEVTRDVLSLPEDTENPQ